uniref:DNA-directed RNA polymerase subunit beta n=1 Tax=Clastoptera arizonana TaxID=38151 RepID=A0A1B6CSM5_9HEMI
MSLKTSLRNLTCSDYGIPSQSQNEILQTLGKPHVDSFNYLLKEGLKQAIKTLRPVEFVLAGCTIKLSFVSAIIQPSAVPAGSVGIKSYTIWPTECRQRGSTYGGNLITGLSWSVDGVEQPTLEKDLGRIPIMIKSDVCYLSGLKPSELIARGEHADEWGGYFIVKGHERLVRMLQMTRRNHPIAVKRSTWKQRGSLFSEYGILMRCVSEDHTSTNNVLHFVTDGSAKLMFSHRKTLYYAPVILIMKCLVDASDEHIFKSIMSGFEDDQYFKGCVLSMLRALHAENIHTHKEAKKFVGKTFRIKFWDLPEWTTDSEVCDFILMNCICIHVNDFKDKFNCLSIMVQKLYSFAQGKSCAEGADAVMMQELLLGGHLYLQVLKDRLQSWLYMLKNMLQKKESPGYKLTKEELINASKRCGLIESSMENFLSTGNLNKNSAISMLQDKGLTIVAENINRMRYMSHFRAVHRGSFFQEMRTTEARQLLPDAWGFICPVHTPDGTPCGLLNHLTKYCEVTEPVDQEILKHLPEVLTSLGTLPLEYCSLPAASCYIVMLDGRLVGRVPKTAAHRLVEKLRVLKIKGKVVPKTLEIVLIVAKPDGGQFPGLYLFTGPARMMRPVYNLASKQIEFIGTLEQVYMDICVAVEDAYPTITTHQELSKDSFLSNLACLIPMPDCNQSPRNMYQCQMGKQTMGTPCHTWHIQAETKLYRLQTPATPLFRPVHYEHINLDDFAMGTNAIVAVISYTGYDMEDAMIINKASYERGFGYGSILKSEFVDLKNAKSYFGLDPNNKNLIEFLGEDGLPFPGMICSDHTPYYCYYDSDESSFKIGYYRGKETVYVDNVRLCGTTSGKDPPTRACITFRVPRNPSVGDKFASRAGQKGICSQKWPAEDLPFTESGLVPDIVFNPHGFPSRMTIAMMIECMAGKSAAVHGLVHDASPFQFSEEDTAIDYFGRLLEAGGYNYYGTERMYSGIDGREMTASIFFGVVHYQRLRHMVSDKWQVRSTGPVDAVTRQPIKGRRRGGGVRFGEMERDGLISHGASYLLQDRLFRCSDESTALLCQTCGTLLGPVFLNTRSADQQNNQEILKCRLCKNNSRIAEINVPYIFRYLVAQLAAVNIKVKIRATSDEIC